MCVCQVIMYIYYLFTFDFTLKYEQWSYMCIVVCIYVMLFTMYIVYIIVIDKYLIDNNITIKILLDL